MSDAQSGADEDVPKPDTGLAADLWLADNAWKEWWLARAADLPHTVYHYTDAAGLLGIVRTGQLWASHANFVNDSGELHYVDALLERVIDDLSREFGADLVRLYLSAIPGLFKEVVVDNFEFYIACFCEDGDQLSQWRGYPSTGGGYAIGFDPAVLGKGRLLRGVIYDVDEQVAVLAGVLRPACELIRDAHAQTYDVDLAYIQKSALMAAQAAVSSIAECSWSFKHPGFAEEKEYRLLRASANERDGRYRVVPEMRASLIGLLPYTPIDFVQPPPTSRRRSQKWLWAPTSIQPRPFRRFATSLPVWATGTQTAWFASLRFHCVSDGDGVPAVSAYSETVRAGARCAS